MNSPKGMRAKVLDYNSQLLLCSGLQFPAVYASFFPSQGSTSAPKDFWESEYLDLILGVVDHQCIGQGVFGELGEVGLVQQGPQSPKHLLLIGQTLGVGERRFI